MLVLAAVSSDLINPTLGANEFAGPDLPHRRETNVLISHNAEKEQVIKLQSNKEDFYNKVRDIFAKKDRQMDVLYKSEAGQLN